MTRSEVIAEHYQGVWGIEPIECPFSDGPLHQLPENFQVIMFPPHGARTMWTYATNCMSKTSDELKIELHIFSPYRSEELVELLYVIAHYHVTGESLGLGHTLNFGRPWIAGANCNYGLISLPYLDGPSLEKLTTGDSTTYFYWLIPITKNEVEFKSKYGLEELERAFDQVAFDYLDPNRISVI